MDALLISTYDLGRQPFGLASPAAWLRDAGLDVACVDLSRQRLPAASVRSAAFVGFFLPMHTATRLALPVIDRVRRLNGSATIAAYGIYATLNGQLLRERGVDEIIGGEFEGRLVEAARRAALNGRSSPAGGDGATTAASIGSAGASGEALEIPRLSFKTPVREGLPPLTRYAALQVGDERRVAGYTEASRGCKHRCRHCPIVPVYDGRFRVVSPDVVMADVRAQVRAGAAHITFGDPDFFNGIRHAREIVQRLASECPGVTYDVTIKVEHLLRHADALPLLRDTGCRLVTSAVESLDDQVLAYLEKGHTRADFERVVALCADIGMQLAPTFLAFTPWTTVESYLEFLAAIDRLRLVEHVAPIQLAIRLLVTDRSRLLALDDIRRVAGPFDPVSLTHPWVHPDRRVDQLHDTVARIVGIRALAPRAEMFARVWHAAHAFAGSAAVRLRELPVLPARAAVPYLTEPWYC